MSAIDTSDAPQENTHTFLTRMIQSLPTEHQKAFYAALLECSNTLRTDSKRLMAIMDDHAALPGDKGRAWHTLLDQFRLLPDTEGRYGMDLGESETGAAQHHPHLAAEVVRMDSQEAEFANRLRGLLKDKNITQQQLAERIECSQPAVSQMLNRKCRPQRRTLDKIATALAVDVRELWPDLEVTDYLDEIAATETDGYAMSESEANALRNFAEPRSAIRGKPLQSRRAFKANHE